MVYLISACLLGTPCRYDGESRTVSDGIRALLAAHTLIPICPEILGGLPTPRPPAERQKDGRIVNTSGEDVTEAYLRGAREALRLARLYRAAGVILKDRSPSCSTGGIYDGSFGGRLIDGLGVTAALLSEAGIPVFSESALPSP